MFDIVVDEELTAQTIFFMHRTMIESFRRCGQFLVMDSTCKTNRFGMNLFLICGFNEHLNCALYGCALMKDETQPSFRVRADSDAICCRRGGVVSSDVCSDGRLRGIGCCAENGCTSRITAEVRVAPAAEHYQEHRELTSASYPSMVQVCVRETREEFDQEWNDTPP